MRSSDVSDPGGMADVYKGKDHKLNRYVAIKVSEKRLSFGSDYLSRSF